MSPMEAMRIYADGACSGNPGRGAWAIHVIYSNGLVEEYGGIFESTTNNRMELTAVIQAMRLAWRVFGSGDRLRVVRPFIYTDSKYVICGKENWLNWKCKGWRGQKGKIVNVDLWKEFIALGPGLFRIIWLKGHNGDPIHDRVDRLASRLSRGKQVDFFRGYPAITISGEQPYTVGCTD